VFKVSRITKVPMLFQTKEQYFYYFVIIFLFITDLVVFFNIPFFQQILGFILITFVPGFLILRILRISNQNNLTTFVFSEGISVPFLLFLGLAINIIFPFFGVDSPLSLISIMISINFCIIFIVIILYFRKENLGISLKDFKSLNIFHLNYSEKGVIILFLLIFSMGILGTYLLNFHQDNRLTLIFFVLIALSLLYVYFNIKKIDKKSVLPVILYILSVSLLLLLALRSNYLIGYDTHEEFHFFISTLQNLRWDPQPAYLLSSTIDISILPTIYVQILNIKPIFLFKGLFCILFAITPLVIYLIALKSVKEFHAFLISCFFMFQELFFNIAANSRTSIALLCFALSIFVLIHKDLTEFQRRILLIVFFFTCVVSSYSSTFIFFFLLLASYLMISAISKISNEKIQINISLVILLIFFVFMFLWYEHIVSQVLRSGLQFTLNRFEIFNNFLHADLSSYSVQMAGSSNLFSNIYSTVGKISRYILFGFIAIGLSVSIIKYLPVSKIDKIKSEYSFFKFDLDLFYLIFSLICAILFFILVFANYFFRGLGIERLYQLLLVILSLYLIIGLFTLINISELIVTKMAKRENLQDDKAKKITDRIGSVFELFLIILLIIQLVDISGISYQMAGYHNSIILNPPNEKSYFGYNQAYVYDQDALIAEWINQYIPEKNSRIIADSLEKRKISSLSNRESMLYSVSIFESTKNEINDGYIILGPTNMNQQILLNDLGNPVPLRDYILTIKNKPLIYDNDGQVFGKTI